MDWRVINFTYTYILISVEDQFIHLNKNRLVYFFGKARSPLLNIVSDCNVDTSASTFLMISPNTLFM